MIKRPFRGSGYRTLRLRRHQAARRRPLADIMLAGAILLLLMLLAARFDQLAVRQLTGPFSVGDGDSLTLAGERIRLRGIDAPELGQQCVAGGQTYACGNEARRALAKLVRHGELICEGRERDRYGRLLARCRAGGLDLNHAMVEAGWAIAYGDYHEAEADARSKRGGLWAGTFERPKDWRARKGQAREEPHTGIGRLISMLRQLFWKAGEGLPGSMGESE
ncbi:thermonuclease family protein [Chelativorans sp. Marseille-P2723]|uniref:thermonuclease family protein n=1 Tax=Chelativorans sp. Marseille-P2723 TaxID=2709133 RepID=UPI00156F7A70|nr:thermonuclease family protein [Chelativorans sp. Marseille-P2723]